MDHVIQAVAATSFLGIGGMVLSHNVDLARQDERIQRIEKLDQKIDDIRTDVTATKESVVRLEARLEAPR